MRWECVKLPQSKLPLIVVFLPLCWCVCFIFLCQNFQNWICRCWARFMCDFCIFFLLTTESSMFSPKIFDIWCKWSVRSHFIWSVQAANRFFQHKTHWILLQSIGSVFPHCICIGVSNRFNFAPFKLFTFQWKLESNRIKAIGSNGMRLVLWGGS